MKKLKCTLRRPCQNCTKRGVERKDKPPRRLACVPCRSRKIRCDLDQPCENCIKRRRESSQAYGSVSPKDQPTPVSPTPTAASLEPSTGTATLETMDYDPTCFEPAIVDVFNIEERTIDPFPSMMPFWPDPPISNPSNTIAFPVDHLNAVHFDAFDRSRLIHDLKQVPVDLKGELPSCVELTAILRQYFRYVDPLFPVIHLPSFSVRTCPSLMLLILLATGDVYSEVHTVEDRARQSFRYLMQEQIHSFDNGGSSFSLASICSLNMWVSELAFRGTSKDMMFATHCRVTVSQAVKLFEMKKKRNFRLRHTMKPRGFIGFARKLGGD